MSLFGLTVSTSTDSFARFGRAGSVSVLSVWIGGRRYSGSGLSNDLQHIPTGNNMPITHSKIVCKKCWKEYASMPDMAEKIPACECYEPDKLPELRLSGGLFAWLFRRWL